MAVWIDCCQEEGVCIGEDICFYIQNACRMSNHVTALHFTLFQHLNSSIGSICCQREFYLLPKETASIQIQIIVTVFYGEFAIKLLVDRSIHDLYRTP